MHKKVYLLMFLLFGSIYYCQAQGRAPGMKWQKYLGTNSYDLLTESRKISLVDRDGGYMIGCSSNSTSGIFAGHHGTSGISDGKDIWVAKLDSQRNVSWSVMLGGTAEESFGSLQVAHDSGYIVAGTVGSTDGDITGNHGKNDAWVVQLDGKGKIVWKKCYGGTQNEVAMYLQKSGDGYIMVGTASSNDGDVSGVHGTETDIWVVKLDRSGNIIWQKCLGGSNMEFANSIKPTADGGYILTGDTFSWDGDVQGSHVTPVASGGTPIPDIWVVKLDQYGAIEWQKCLGGSKDDHSYDVELTAAGDYMVAGGTLSEDGDVTGYHGWETNQYAMDAWVVNLSKTGSIKWQKCFGGKGDDEFHDIQQLPDHTFVGVGATDFKGGDVSAAYGGGDCWVVNFKDNGDLIWEKTFGSPGVEYGSSFSLTRNGNMVIAGSYYYNSYDVWLFEVGAINTIAGRVFYDANSDGIQNNGESAFDKITIKSGKNGDTLSAIPMNGTYTMNVDTGTYETRAIPYNNYYTVVPAAKTTTFNSYFNTDSVHFAVQPVPGILDANISLLPLAPARPGFPTQCKIVYKNVGTTPIANGTITLVKDQHLTLNNAMPVGTTTNGNTISWTFNNLNPNNEASITLNFVLDAPPAVNFGDTVKSKAWITLAGTDITPKDDTAVLKQLATGSYDPNDKTEANAGVITPDQVNNGEYLNYTIRFQNMGTDTAFTVTVRDTLESRLDWSSLQMVSASHAYQLSIENGNKLTWQFNDIKLPHSGIDEPNSHGYIAYRIKPKPTVMAGETIINTAGIYFDYNLPVATNAAKTLVTVLATLPVTLTSFKAALNGDVVNVTWKTSLEENIKQFEVERSANGVDFTTIGRVQPGQTNYLYIDKQPLTGFNYYRLKMVDIDGGYKHSPVVLVNVKDEASIISSLYPNPGNGNIQLKLQGVIEGNVLVQVIDQQGRPVVTKQYGVQNTGEFKTPIVLNGLSKGTYILRITVNDKTYFHKLLIQ